MRNILLVEDDANQRFLLSEVLSTSFNDLKPIEAENGKIALDQLARHSIDIVLTDLKMPVLDGFGLITRMRKDYPNIPIIVLSSMNLSLFKQKVHDQGTLQYLQKPVKSKVLVEKIKTVLSNMAKGFITGITIPSFLQLLGMENKTCSLLIQNEKGTGYLHIDKGMIINASCKKLTGDRAAYKIIGWIHGDIKILDLQKDIDPKITSDLSHILLEALRIKDEESALEEQAKAAAELAVRKTPEERKEEALLEVPDLFAKSSNTLGYLATVLLGHAGEMLASHTNVKTLDIEGFAKRLHQQYIDCQKTITEFQEHPCMEQMITTANSLIVIKNQGPFYLISISTEKGNPAIIRLEQKQALKVIQKRLAPFFQRSVNN